MSLVQTFQTCPALFATVAGIFGLAIGSFLNVVIYRLPRMLERRWRAETGRTRGPASRRPASPRFNLAVPRSECPKCGHRITALENIPLVSYIVLRGRCSACKVPISPRYFAVELLTGLLSGFVAWRYGTTASTAAALLFVWAIVALSVHRPGHLLPAG